MTSKVAQTLKDLVIEYTSMTEERINESPGLVSDMQFGLDNALVNQKLLADALSNRTKTYEETGEICLFQANQMSDGAIVLWNKKYNRLDFISKTKKENVRGLGDAICQTGVWNSGKGSYSQHLGSKVVFEIVLKEYKTLISDRLQTASGRRYWNRLMTEASGKMLTVGLVDEKSGNVSMPESKGLESYEDWSEHKGPISYGYDPKFQRLRFFIKKS